MEALPKYTQYKREVFVNIICFRRRSEILFSSF